MDEVKCNNNVVVLEVAPSQVLEDLVVFVIVGQGCLVGALSLSEVTFFFIQQADLEQRVDLAFVGEAVRQDRILEVIDRLINLVCLCKDDSKLIKDL